jgi:chromosome segregation ATPase
MIDRGASTLQTTAARSALDEARVELEQLRPLREALSSQAGELEAARAELEAAHAELNALRQAREAQTRQLVSGRLAFAAQLESEAKPLRENVEWRKGVMEAQEKRLEMLQQSRSLRYTEPLRRIAAALRRR